MNEIKLNTLLGNLWEPIVAEVLTDLSIQYEQSPDLGEGVIAPDFVCRSSQLTIFVTCTSTRESFIKKRWRYINELFQTKAILGERMLVANLILSNDANLQGIEAVIFGKLFDLVVFGNTLTGFDELTSAARNLLGSGKTVPSAHKRLSKMSAYVRFKSALSDWITVGVDTDVRKNIYLWELITRFDRKRVVADLVPNSATYWRRVCLKLLPMLPHERVLVLKGTSRDPLPAKSRDRIKRMGIEVRKVLGGGARFFDEEIASTLANGFNTDQVLLAVEALERLNEESVGFPIEEVLGTDLLVEAHRRYESSFSSSDEFSARAIADFESDDLRRIKVWEYGVALAETSVLEFNKQYVRKYGHVVVANPINNVILKTDVAAAIAEKVDIKALVQDASRILWSLLPNQISQDIFIERVSAYRYRSLFLQPYLNPTQVMFENVVESLTGNKPTLTKSDCLLRDLGVPGRASRVESLYVHQQGSRKILFKVLSGYKGGYEHKADEMASRAWLLRFRVDPDSAKPYQDEILLVFVYEGEWDRKYLGLLRASGWDVVVHLSDIDKLKELWAT